MSPNFANAIAALLVPLAIIITYYDVRYRRIPNIFVLATLLSGIILNITFNGWGGVLASLQGCLLAFGLMFVLHMLGAMGAGDVKLFAAIGAVVGAKLVFPTFLVVALTGGVLAVVAMVRSGSVRTTLHGVLQIFVGMMPGWKMPRFAVPADRSHTIPYGVAITLGSLISIAVFRA
jgi:prepilin peptidase CpaA